MKFDFNMKHNLFLKSEPFLEQYILENKGVIEDLYTPNVLFLIEELEMVEKCLEWYDIDLLTVNASNENILMYKKANISIELLEFYLKKGLNYGNKDPFLLFKNSLYIELLFKYSVPLKEDSYYLTGQHVNLNFMKSFYEKNPEGFFDFLENEIKKAINKKIYTSLKYHSLNQYEILKFFLDKKIPNNILLLLFKSHIIDINLLDDVIKHQGVYAVNILNKLDVLDKPLLFSYINKKQSYQSLEMITDKNTGEFYEDINWLILGYNKYENITMFMHDSLFKIFIDKAPDYLIAAYASKFLINIDSYQELEMFINKTHITSIFKTEIINGEESIITIIPLPLFCLAIDKKLIKQKDLPLSKKYNLSNIFHNSLNIRINSEQYFSTDYQSKKDKDQIIYFFNLVLSNSEKKGLDSFIDSEYMEYLNKNKKRL